MTLRITHAWSIVSVGATVGLSVGLAWSAAVTPLHTLLCGAALLVGFALLRVPVAALPAIALAVFALVPTPYLGLPRLVGSFLAPPILILAVWEARVLLGMGRPRIPSRAWVVAAVGTCLLLVPEAMVSAHRGRSFAWSLAFLVSVPLAAVAASVSQQSIRKNVIRVWTALGILLGSAALIEATLRWNPFASRFVIDGEPLRQTWSVYRIETTLGHPLYNAMFFSVTAAAMVGLMAQRVTVARTASAALSLIAVVLTASRSGALAAAIGTGVVIAAMTASRSTSLSKKVLVLAAVAVGVATVSQASVLKQRDRSAEGQSSVAYRTQLFHQAVQIVRDNPVFGSGPATSQFRLAETGSHLTFENSVLQVAVSTGLPGVALVLGLVAWSAVIAMRRRHWEALGGTVACVICVSGFNVWDQIPASFALLAFVVSLGCSERAARVAEPSVLMYAGHAPRGREIELA